MPVLHAAGIDQFHEISGDGPPVVLVAGMGGTANYWREQMAAFTTRHRVLVYDQRGTGRTTHAHVASIEQLAGDLVALLDALKLDRVDLVTHSTGGNIGQVMALDHPGRLGKLVLYSSTTHGDPYRTLVWRVRRAILEKLGPELYADMASIMLYPPAWIAQHYDELMQQQVAQMRMLPAAEVQVSRIEAVQAFDRRAELGRIAAPTLVVCAKDDNQTPAYFSEALAKAIPGARLVLLEGGGHAASRVHPDAFNKLVLEFLATA
ncbi:MAG: alpha/beta fold hydrolase [Alphaproteobacteria bacterium]|nr:alpha/beta fold hydrolase [Alphaproteobacteria bacterium]